MARARGGEIKSLISYKCIFYHSLFQRRTFPRRRPIPIAIWIGDTHKLSIVLETITQQRHDLLVREEGKSIKARCVSGDHRRDLTGRVIDAGFSRQTQRFSEDTTNNLSRQLNRR